VSVNTVKIRLGACDQMTMYAGTLNALDLGASAGGAELSYNPTVLLVEIDQTPMPVTAFRTKEELLFDVAIVQFQMNLLSFAWAYASSTVSNVTTTSSAALTPPTGGTATTVGTAGSTTYTYEWVAFCSTGDSVPGTTFSDTTGPTTLSSTNYVQITAPSAVPGAVGYKLVRTVGGSSQGLIATFYGLPPTVNDTGLTATAYSASGSNPTAPNSDASFLGGTVTVPNGTFDFAVPKNDGTSNHLRGHLRKVVSSKATKLGFMRDKITEASKLSLACLADMTQTVGQQAGYIVEEY
jgi:hypothetical protein